PTVTVTVAAGTATSTPTNTAVPLSATSTPTPSATSTGMPVVPRVVEPSAQPTSASGNIAGAGNRPVLPATGTGSPDGAVNGTMRFAGIVVIAAAIGLGALGIATRLQIKRRVR